MSRETEGEESFSPRRRTHRFLREYVPDAVEKTPYVARIASPEVMSRANIVTKATNRSYQRPVSYKSPPRNRRYVPIQVLTVPAELLGDETRHEDWPLKISRNRLRAKKEKIEANSNLNLNTAVQLHHPPPPATPLPYNRTSDDLGSPAMSPTISIAAGASTLFDSADQDQDYMDPQYSPYDDGFADDDSDEEEYDAGGSGHDEIRVEDLPGYRSPPQTEPRHLRSREDVDDGFADPDSDSHPGVGAGAGTGSNSDLSVDAVDAVESESESASEYESEDGGVGHATTTRTRPTNILAQHERPEVFVEWHTDGRMLSLEGFLMSQELLGKFRRKRFSMDFGVWVISWIVIVVLVCYFLRSGWGELF